MSKIYKITNLINGKSYIGKTNFSIHKRFQEHYNDAFKNEKSKRPLYLAIQKYGIQNFKIEEIENCSSSEAGEREKYWISFYHTYEDGYNATRGGDGTQLYPIEDIIKRLKEYPYPCDIAKEFNCSASTVRLIAKENKIPVKIKGGSNKTPRKNIFQYDKNTNELLNIFSSAQEAAEWIENHGYSKAKNGNSRSHIAECAKGSRKTAYGFIWKYN